MVLEGFRKGATVNGVFRYGLYGVGRIGRVHGQIVKEQGHVIAAVGDEVRAAAEEAGS